MRIVSNVKDYYDSASGYGVDTTVVYNRKERILDPRVEADSPIYNDIKAAVDKATSNDRIQRLDRFANHSTVVIGVAGKLYIGLRFFIDGRPEVTEKRLFVPFRDFNIPTTALFAWNASNLTPEQLATKSGTFIHSGNVGTPGEFFEKNEGKLIVEDLDLFTKHNIVTFAAVITPQEHIIRLDPCLLDWGFQKVLDSFTAFQEISMHVSGVLAQKEQMMHVPTDKELLYARGHDDMSFKTPPTKKR